MPNPIKPNFKTELFPIILILIAFASSFYFYSVFPPEVPTHWNFNGEVDQWSSKAVGAFLFPAIILGMYILFLVLPFADPKKERYSEFAKTYHIFKTIMITIFTLLYFATSLSSAGIADIPIGLFTTFLIGSMFIVIGNYMSKLKSNWFVGIKTPWTLSSEEVWNKTHRLGGKIFIVSGFIMMAMQFLPAFFRLPLFILIIIMMTVGTFGYSYYAYRKENKKSNTKTI